jgi:acylphosphatase
MIENFGDNINTNGFDKNPENAVKGGRKPSIKKQLIELLESDGEIKIEPDGVVSIENDGSVIIKVPTEMQIAMKLKQWAMSKKGNDSIKAIQMIMDQIDGKAKNSIDITSGNQPLSNLQNMSKTKIIVQQRCIVCHPLNN